MSAVSLQEEVERLLPSWRRWYPSLFDAANDLGLIRARVCSPDSLLLSRRHSRIQRSAEAAHREQWGGGPEDPEG
jgi:hypothetical protein